jgi:transcriptional regulator with XRE-family HTH domain
VLRIHYERLNQRKTQAELGLEVGIHQNTVSLIERGRFIPDADQLERLAFVLKVSPPSALMHELVVVEAVSAVSESAEVSA